ncbi:hypothetical protein ABT160_42870 [Streptomyces sp. NPDC001941]|uniref:hypothetical protein n=1 Tax=Streptomyces sp. NPDC001941 TaxID=3154659 RepID=UPI00332A542D
MTPAPASAPTYGVLEIPLHVEAFALNSLIRRAEPFERWQPNYALTRLHMSPEPPPFSSVDFTFKDDPANEGVYLHWQLPDALTHGEAPTPGAAPVFPLAPNRWRITRTATRTDQPATVKTGAWIVESDYLGPDATTPYLDPHDPEQRKLTRIGRRRPAEGWSEPGTRADDMFLTAVGPGLLAFSAYQPYNLNVFSLHDPLTDCDRTHAWTIDYHVEGWYSDPAADPLAPAHHQPEHLTTLLEAYDWPTPPDDVTVSADPVIRLNGGVTQLDWQNTLYASDRPDTVTVAVGHDLDHANTALTTAAARAAGLSDDTAAILAACYAGTLDVLDDPDGHFEAERLAHTAHFTPSPAGYRWTLEQNPDTPPARALARPRRHLLADHTALLATLNTDQQTHDSAATHLTGTQRRLYDLWWSRNLPRVPDEPDTPAGHYAARLDEAIDEAREAVTAALAALHDARVKIPWGEDDDELQASITTWAADHNLPDEVVLKREVLAHHQAPNDPSVILVGHKHDTQHTDRPARHTHTTPRPASPAPQNSPDPEARWLPQSDPATRPQDTAPLTPWRQPWTPVFFEWQVHYYPIEFGTAHDDHWHFDGTHYHLTNDTGFCRTPLTLHGRNLLTTAAGDIPAARLREAAHHLPEAATLLNELADQIRQAAPTSQTLTGFNDQLNARSFQPPVLGNLTDPLLRDALEAAADRGLPPNPGPAPRPFTGWAPTACQPLRTGQFVFNRLALVDRFGHTLHAVYPDPVARVSDDPEDAIGVGFPASQFIPTLPPELEPSLKNPDDPDQGRVVVHPADAERLIQLTPRLPQSARIHFTLLNAKDNTHHTTLTRSTEPDATPIAAWLIPHHLDQTLLCYDPDGTGLGQLRTTLTTTGTRHITWHPLPHSPHPDPDTLANTHPHLHQFLQPFLNPTHPQAGTDADPDTLTSLLRVIDRVMTTTTPQQEITPETPPTTLMGRPVALIRTRLQIDLDATPDNDPSWNNLPTPTPRPHPTYRWPIRLGERLQLGDGLIGYYQGTATGTDYHHLHTVLDPNENPHDPYFTPITNGHNLTLPAHPPTTPIDNNTHAYLTLLADPHATIHATTDLLPTATTQVPTHLTTTTLEHLNTAFRIGPLLTTPAPHTDDTTAERTEATNDLTLPRPSDQYGTWTWSEAGTHTPWTTHPTQPTTPTPHTPHPAPVLRTGYLQLHPTTEDTTHQTANSPASDIR